MGKICSRWAIKSEKQEKRRRSFGKIHRKSWICWNSGDCSWQRERLGGWNGVLQEHKVDDGNADHHNNQQTLRQRSNICCRTYGAVHTQSSENPGAANGRSSTVPSSRWSRLTILGSYALGMAVLSLSCAHGTQSDTLPSSDRTPLSWKTGQLRPSCARVGPKGWKVQASGRPVVSWRCTSFEDWTIGHNWLHLLSRKDTCFTSNSSTAIWQGCWRCGSVQRWKQWRRRTTTWTTWTRCSKWSSRTRWRSSRTRSSCGSYGNDYNNKWSE